MPESYQNQYSWAIPQIPVFCAENWPRNIPKPESIGKSTIESEGNHVMLCGKQVKMQKYFDMAKKIGVELAIHAKAKRLRLGAGKPKQGRISKDTLTFNLSFAMFPPVKRQGSGARFFVARRCFGAFQVV